MKKGSIGHWAFIAGVLIAVLAAVAGLMNIALDAGTVAMLLVVLGVIVGFLNISQKEMTGFLVAAIALILSSAANLGSLPVIGGFATDAVSNIATFVAPAAVIVALKAVIDLGKK